MPRPSHEELLSYERPLWSRGLTFVAGLDEAGAGPWAGPVAAGCVVLDPARTGGLVGVYDSKQISEKKREAMVPRIEENALAFAVALASPEEIDRVNIRQACLLAMKRALAAVEAQLGAAQHLLIDARKLDGVRCPQSAIIRGDSSSLSIAAASILAKVHRDHLMMEAALRYPAYGFERHKGYGTTDHKQALLQHGPCPLHRRSFSPIRELVAEAAVLTKASTASS
jgi:ribonuclease HII